MKRILVFGASNSSSSINQQLATYAAQMLTDVQLDILHIHDYEMPLYRLDREQAQGIPQLASDFHDKIKASDGIIISFAEHNGSYSAAYKNLMDWTSRLEGGLWQDKPILAMATSPGGRGGLTVLESAADRMNRMSGRVVATFSLPSFGANYSDTDGITDDGLQRALTEALLTFKEAL